MRLAHLTDTHIDGSRDRADRFARALDAATASGAQHLLLTGDLTGHGRPAEWEGLARGLDRWPEGATVVSGNHDGPGFAQALAGSLRRFAATSSAPVDLGAAVVVPVSTYYPRRALLFRALGNVGRAQMATLERVAVGTRKPVVLAMHHPPHRDPIHTFAGLLDRHRIERLLTANSHVFVCCGHDHRVLDVGRVFVAASCATHPDPLRIYDVAGGRLSPVYQSGCEGSYFGQASCPMPAR